MAANFAFNKNEMYDLFSIQREKQALKLMNIYNIYISLQSQGSKKNQSPEQIRMFHSHFGFTTQRIHIENLSINGLDYNLRFVNTFSIFGAFCEHRHALDNCEC